MTPRFVVAQVGHTGSAYIAQVLTAAGVRCGHEAWFNPLGERDETLVGDSSWCSVLELGAFAGLVFHQVREPLAVIRSLVDEGIGVGWDTPYTRLRHRIIGGPSGDPMADVVKCCAVMNETIERHAVTRWRVEDVDADLVVDIAKRVGIPVESGVAAAAVAAVSTGTNPHRIHDVEWHDLPGGQWLDMLCDQAERYGYR